MATRYAFVTLVSSDPYVHGALTLAASLRDIHPTPPSSPEVDFETVCLVTPETLDVSNIKLLRRAFDVVVGVEVITQKDDAGLALLGRPDLSTVLTKLHVFRLTEYSKIIFLDADILPIRPLSHLFTLPYDFSASPDTGWPDIFNSGVMVLSPGEGEFKELTELLRTKGTWDGGDQGLLNEWRGGNWNRLSFTYNTTPTAAYTYAPAYERFGSQISAIHFIGPHKPWHSISSRPPFSQAAPNYNSQDRAYDYNTLLDQWFAVYDRHYRSQAISHEPIFEVKQYESVWNKSSQADTSERPALRPGLSLEQLRQLALEGINAGLRSPYDEESDTYMRDEGQYVSLPLHGRVDLMRPVKNSLIPTPKKIAMSVPQERDQSSGEVTKSDILPTEEDPHTPIARTSELSTSSSPGRSTLSTPGPNEIPPSPHPHPIPLPPTTPSLEGRVASQPPAPSVALDSPSRLSLKDQPSLLDSESRIKHSDGVTGPRRDAPKPHSPTMLLWNPAVEPPPTDMPVSSPFPTNTYFSNVWDSSALRTPQQTRAAPNTSPLFDPVPPIGIPQELILQGHYRNVTGEEQPGATPSPDRSKVKSIFPWEGKPRHLPGRVFPITDSPTPSLFLSPESQSSETSSDLPTTPEAKVTRSSAQLLSPLHGLATSLSYPSNMPSFQKHAMKLAELPEPRPLAAAFNEDSGDEKLEASSRDGDIEDEGEDSDSEPVVEKSSGFHDSDDESGKALKRRSRQGSYADIYRAAERYRNFGVQTIQRKMRTLGVQTVMAPPGKLDISQTGRRPTLSGRRHWAPSNRANVLPAVTVHDSTTVGATNARHSPKLEAQPSGLVAMTRPAMLSPRPSKITTPPSPSALRGAHSPGIARRTSNESSPASSIGPISPLDAQLAGSPSERKGGRVWDPARGVELFKRGSEEVLARFLRMGSWEEENH